MESKKAKLEEEKEDRISDLPDPLIHHILSFLPSTKKAIQTGILSKRWVNQWTRVPVLIFDSTGMSIENFHRFTENTLILHDCSKIKKFQLNYGTKHINAGRLDPQFSSKIQFATRKAVQDLSLRLNHEYMLPKFLFNNASLVRLSTDNCIFMPNGKVTWECLTTLSMAHCRLADGVMELILSGSPLLKMLSLLCCLGFSKLVIASELLKLLVLEDINSPFDIEISCPQLEELKLLNTLNVMTAKLLNLSSSLCANINFRRRCNGTPICRVSLVKEILQQLMDVKELTIGNWLLESLPAIQVGGLFSPVFNVKCVTLKSHNISGIACLLRCLPVLEKLVIDVTCNYQDNYDFRNKYWSAATVSNCNVSHLKTIKIIGVPERHDKHRVWLKLAQFFLENARVLEKMEVGVSCNCFQLLRSLAFQRDMTNIGFG